MEYIRILTCKAMTTDEIWVRILIYNDCGTEKFLNVFFPVLLFLATTLFMIKKNKPEVSQSPDARLEWIFIVSYSISMINIVRMHKEIQKDWNSKTSNICPNILHVDADARV